MSLPVVNACAFTLCAIPAAALSVWTRTPLKSWPKLEPIDAAAFALDGAGAEQRQHPAVAVARLQIEHAARRIGAGGRPGRRVRLALARGTVAALDLGRPRLLHRPPQS